MQIIRCSICLSEMWNNIVVLKCGHIYHFRCMQKWSLEQETCPYCRTKARIDEVNLAPAPDIASVIEEVC